MPGRRSLIIRILAGIGVHSLAKGELYDFTEDVVEKGNIAEQGPMAFKYHSVVILARRHESIRRSDRVGLRR